MRPVVSDVCVSVGQITMSDATTAEPMEMPFGAWTSVGPMNFFWWGPGFLLGKRHIWGRPVRCGLSSMFLGHLLLVCYRPR